ncbi:hypothetical protein PENSPDRAFT_378909 [Peniophora sp. CONT]|nr:hypothetical protein PENSPDRAFT_378909 [Peniophora sp. CONT]
MYAPFPVEGCARIREHYTRLTCRRARHARPCGNKRDRHPSLAALITTSMAADPTYPLRPIVSLLAAVLLLLVLLHSFTRRNLNIGVGSLCVWLFLENVADAINAIIWHNNAHVRLHAYCDIVSRLQIITYVVKPMSTAAITRRLYLIITLKMKSFSPSTSKTVGRWNLFVEWSLVSIAPVLVAGPFYYIVQDCRFEVLEGFGCTPATAPSVLTILLLPVCAVMSSLMSVAIYYPTVAGFYRHAIEFREVIRYLRERSSLSYARLIALASLDILYTLPVAVAFSVLFTKDEQGEARSLPFYPGWEAVHSNWTARSVTYAEMRAAGNRSLALVYLSFWSSSILAFVVFGFFGVNGESRASYWRIVCGIGGWFGWKPIRNSERRVSLGDPEFGPRPPLWGEVDLEAGPSFAEGNLEDRAIDAEERSLHSDPAVPHMIYMRSLPSFVRSLRDIDGISVAESDMTKLDEHDLEPLATLAPALSRAPTCHPELSVVPHPGDLPSDAREQVLEDRHSETREVRRVNDSPIPRH